MRVRAASPSWPWGVAFCAAGLSAVAHALPAPMAAALLAPTLLLTPGAAAQRRLFANAPPETRALAAFALSPFLSAGPFALLLVLGVPLATAARIVVLGVALAAGLAWRDTRRSGAGDSAPVVWLVALAWSGIIALLFAVNPWLAPRSDGWFHAGVTLQIAQRGVPPEDPYWAGLRLLYFWGADAASALWLVLAPRLSVWTPLVLFNISAAFAVALGVAALARRLGARARHAAAAMLLAIGGYAPFAWLQIAARAAGGEVRGWAEVTRQVHAGIDALLGTMAAGQLHASLAFFGDKFLVPTAFGMGLALFALVLVALGALTERPDAGRAMALGVALAATLFTHTVVGYAAVLTCCAWWLERVRTTALGGSRAREALAPLALAVLAALLAAAPYLMEITQGKRGQLALGGGLAALRSFLFGGALFVVPGFAWLLRRAARSPDARLVLLAAAIFSGCALALRLPENNQSKFLNLLYLVLAAPALLGWAALAARLPATGRAVLTAGLLTATVPGVALALWGFAADRGRSFSTWDAWRAGTPTHAAMLWMRAHTPADALLCDTGGARDVLAVAGRSVIWGGPGGERDWGYDPAALRSRRELVSALSGGGEPAGTAAALWATLRRPTYVVVRAAEAGSPAATRAMRARPERFERVYADSALSLWHVRRAP